MIIKNDKIIQHGGFVMQLFFFLLMICLVLCSSCACSSWPVDLDTFLGGTFKGLKIKNPFSGLFDNDIFKGITGPLGSIFKL